MDQLNFHKQKLYALIAAGVALVAMILPWITFLGTSLANGFRSWGILSLLGIISVGAITFIGDKAAAYTAEHKKLVGYAFAAIALGAVLFFLRKNSFDNGIYSGLKTGLGLWLCLIAGLGGLALLYGFIKIENKKTV